MDLIRYDYIDMLAGLIQACGKAVGAIRGATKSALGQNPNSPFNLMNLLHQFYSPKSGGAARSEGQSDNRASSIADQVSRNSSAQTARAAPPTR